MNRDYTNVGHAQLLANSSWGIGVLTLQNGQFASAAMGQSGAVLGGWRLDAVNNQLGPCGNFDGGTQCSIFISSAWGIGTLKAGAGSFASVAGAGNGTVLAVQSPIGGATATWTIDSAHAQFGPVGNFEGTGHDILMVRLPNGMATLRQAGTGFNVGVAIWDNALVAGLSINHSDRFGPVGDFDGDGADELVVVGAQGVWVLRPRADRFGWITFVGNGTTFGDWTLDTTQDQFGPAGDFDGDGKAELIVWRGGRFAMLKVTGPGFTIMAEHQPGDWLGGWRLGGGDKLVTAADFNGDRKAELLITSGWGCGVLAWTGGAFVSSCVTQNGTACTGGWRLDTLRDRMTLAADFDGDGKAELLVSSSWGIGLLDLSGAAPAGKEGSANGVKLGAWSLDTLHDDLTAGAFRTDAIVAWNDNFHDVAQSTISHLTQRGSFVSSYIEPATFIAGLQAYAATCAAGDRLFVYIALDGNGQARPDGDTTQTPCGQHWWQFTDGSSLDLGQISPMFRTIAARGVDLVVFDGACSGGETVYDAWDQGYCAMSTTSMNDVGLTNLPDPGLQISQQDKPCVAGCWWSSPHMLASRMNGAIALAAFPSHRVQQRLFRNDGTAMTKAALFGRPTLSILYGLSAWWLDASEIYLFPIIFGDTGTTPASQHVNPVQSLMALFDQRITALQGNHDTYTAMITSARTSASATIYANNWAAIWQCLANDPTWNVEADSEKYSAQMNLLSPAGYQGVQGFLNLVDLANGCIFSLNDFYQRERALLVQIDAAVRASPTLGHLAPPLPPSPPPVTLKLKPLDGQVPASIALQKKLSTQLHAIAQRVNAPAMQWPPGPPTAASVHAAIGAQLTHWTAAALTSPTGDATVDALVAQLLACYQQQESPGNTACFLLPIIEDVLVAQQSANLVVPGDAMMI